jgi:hypothetical protein
VHEAFQDYVKQKDTKFSGVASHEEQFASVSVWGKVDEVFIMETLKAHTDLEDLGWLLVCKHPDAVTQMFEFTFQLAPTLRVLPDLQVKEVMKRFLKARGEALGWPLAKLKELKGVASNGELQWKAVGAYTPTFNSDGHLEKLKHRSGDEVEVSTALGKDSSIRFIWSDWRAMICCPPMPDVKLHVFFKQAKKGPYTKIASAPDLYAKSKFYSDAVDTIFAEWQEERNQVRGQVGVSETIMQVKKSRDEAATVLRRTRMEEAREKGTAALKRRREAADVKFDS